MKRITILASALCVMAFSSSSIAAGPGSDNKTKYDLRIGRCNVDSVTVKWKLESILGEPTVAGSFKWTGDSDCTLPSSTTVWLKVKDGSSYAHVKLSPATPDANEGYGYNTTGSPNWKKLLCGYRGTRKVDCFSKSEAKDLWRNGYVSDISFAWN